MLNLALLSRSGLELCRHIKAIRTAAITRTRKLFLGTLGTQFRLRLFIGCGDNQCDTENHFYVIWVSTFFICGVADVVYRCLDILRGLGLMKMASPCFPPKPLPASETPAWNKNGVRCADGSQKWGPGTSKYFPLW
jgi:hypothetical protein